MSHLIHFVFTVWPNDLRPSLGVHQAYNHPHQKCCFIAISICIKATIPRKWECGLSFLTQMNETGLFWTVLKSLVDAPVVALIWTEKSLINSGSTLWCNLTERKIRLHDTLELSFKVMETLIPAILCTLKRVIRPKYPYLSKRHYFFIPSILKGRYTIHRYLQHTRVWLKWLKHTPV